MRIKKSEERVYHHLKEQIETGELAVKTKIVEEDLATDLNVSRSPVRSGIKRLAEEGYLKIVPYKGAYVQARPLSQQDYLDKLEVYEFLLNHYLFQVESKQLALPLVELKALLKEITLTLKAGNLGHGVELETQFMALFLSKQRNQYYQQIIREITQHILTADVSEVQRDLAAIAQEYCESFENVITFIEEEKYPHSRREIRIFINNLTLAIIDCQELGNQNKYDQ